MKIIIFCDIDGTIIPQYFSKEQPNPPDMDKISLSEQVKITLNKLYDVGYFLFITGRGYEWKKTTEDMLSVLNNKTNVIYSNYGDYTDEKYYKFKLEKIALYSKLFEMVMIMDDNLELLRFIQQEYKNHQKIIILFHTYFNKTLKTMECLQIL